MFEEHIEHATTKVNKFFNSLNKLMPNVTGSSQNKKRVMAVAIQYISMYAVSL